MNISNKNIENLNVRRNYLILLIVIIVSISCNKEKEPVPEYINYNSEILFGKDTLLYGIWENVPSNVILLKRFRGIDIPYQSHIRLVIKPFGNYQRFLYDTLQVSGKLDTLYYGSECHLAVAFCPDGIKRERESGRFLSFHFLGNDTIYFYPLGCSDCVETYYIRKK